MIVNDLLEKENMQALISVQLELYIRLPRFLE